MRSRRVRGGGSQAGIALLLVVWLLALLTVIAGEFMASGRVKAAAEHNKRDDLRGLALALAGYRAAVAALDDKIDGLELDAEQRLLLHYQGLTEGVPAAAADVPLGDGTYSWRIDDEDGLVNINKAQRPVLANLLQQCGLEFGAERDTVIDSILDWRDANRNHRLNGAEEDYYRGLDPPYSCKDGPFDVVEELLLVRGVTPALFAGIDVDGQKKIGLHDLISTRAPDQPNAWTAPQAVLEACGLERPVAPARPNAVSRHFVIVATGKPAGGGPSRTLRAVVLREDEGDSRSFTLVYWNDTYTPE
ncbi:MAG: type II secretion system minor pseudopilin [Candidatus Methylomirabilia bacterium]